MNDCQVDHIFVSSDSIRVYDVIDKSEMNWVIVRISSSMKKCHIIHNDHTNIQKCNVFYTVLEHLGKH